MAKISVGKFVCGRDCQQSCSVTASLENICSIVERQAQDIAIYKKLIYTIAETKHESVISDILGTVIPYSLTTTPVDSFLRNLILDLREKKKPVVEKK